MDYPPAPPPPPTPPSQPQPDPQPQLFPMPYNVSAYPVSPEEQATAPVTPTAPAPPRPRDPLAVALGNASLLGVGYLLLRRRWLAVLTVVVSVTLVVLLTASVRTVGFELVVVAWWLLTIAHGWFLASRGPVRATLRGQRIVGGAFAGVVLLVFGVLRWQSLSIEGDVTDARAAGDCPAAVSALDRVWLGDRVANAPMTVRGEETSKACKQLSAAGRELADGLDSGSAESLDAGFDGLGRVLAEHPGHEHMVDTVLDKFLHGLPTGDACRTTQIDNWLDNRADTHDGLDRAADIVPRTAPEALLGCGDSLMSARDYETARQNYQQLVQHYPDDSRVPKAKAGIRKATLAIQLGTLRSSVSDGSYCSQPAAYPLAPTYHKGANRVMFLGQSGYANRLPSGWHTTDPAHAGMIACLGTITNGPVVDTCTYRNSHSGIYGSVAFHKIAIPVRGYSVRTGKLVVRTTIYIGGASCPEVFFDYGEFPPSDKFVDPSDENVRAGFRFLVYR